MDGTCKRYDELMRCVRVFAWTLTATLAGLTVLIVVCVWFPPEPRASRPPRPRLFEDDWVRRVPFVGWVVELVDGPEFIGGHDKVLLGDADTWETTDTGL